MSADRDYGEFAIAAHYGQFLKEFPHDVDFVVGQSDAKTEWPYILPGPADAWAGSKVHEFKIHFQIKITPKREHVFAYIMNNYWHTNYKAKQGGRLVFQYSLTSSAACFSKKDAVVNGWNIYCPAVAARGKGEHEAIPSSAATSLVNIKPAGLPLTTIKEAEDRTGFIFRYCDFSGTGGTAKLTLPKPASEVFRCNLVETDASKLSTHSKTIKVAVKPFAPMTIKTRFAP